MELLDCSAARRCCQYSFAGPREPSAPSAFGFCWHVSGKEWFICILRLGEERHRVAKSSRSAMSRHSPSAPNRHAQDGPAEPGMRRMDQSPGGGGKSSGENSGATQHAWQVLARCAVQRRAHPLPAPEISMQTCESRRDMARFPSVPTATSGRGATPGIATLFSASLPLARPPARPSALPLARRTREEPGVAWPTARRQGAHFRALRAVPSVP